MSPPHTLYATVVYKVNVLTTIVPMQVDYILLLSFQEEFLDEFTSLRDGLKDLRVLSGIS